MIDLYSPAQIHNAEAQLIQEGIDEILMMERAASGLMQALPTCNGAIGILCGKGNNAGDGYALAVQLAERGDSPILYCFSEKLTPAAEHYRNLSMQKQIPIRTALESDPFFDCELLVDCLFGTGFRGDVQSPYREIILAANASGLPILSADIPSGLNAISGLGDLCIHATKTVAIGGMKYGNILGRGRDACGELSVWDIGLVPKSDVSLIEAEDIQSIFQPRPHYCHKGTFGTVTLLGGCLPYSGAPKLAAMAAASLRSGCGIARLAIPSCLANSVLPYILETTLSPLPHKNGFLQYNEEALNQAFTGSSAAAIGMGMGQSTDNEAILQWALENLSIPLVIDADGLNTLVSMDLSILSRSSCTVVLTPHPKEFSRLSGVQLTDVLSDPVRYARDFAKEHHCIVLLKGTATVISDGKDTLVVNRGSGGMATAGSGDILSGVLASLLAWSSEDPLLTVAAGALVTGVAGEIASNNVGSISMIASDTVSALPTAIRSLFQT